jgi:hypothetical protein
LTSTLVLLEKKRHEAIARYESPKGHPNRVMIQILKKTQSITHVGLKEIGMLLLKKGKFTIG